MESNTTELHMAVNCPICSFTVVASSPFCSHCGFPLNGSEDAKQKFDLEYKIKRAEFEGAKETTLQGTKALYWMSGLAFLTDLAFFAYYQDLAYLIGGILVPVLFLPLALWSKKKPFIALVTALVLYSTLIIVDAVADPFSIYRGSVVKIIVIYYLVKGIRSAQNAQQIQKELAQRNWNQ